MFPTHVSTDIRHVLRAINAVRTIESRRLAALKFRMIIKIVLVTEDTWTPRTGKLRLLDEEIAVDDGWVVHRLSLCHDRHEFMPVNHCQITVWNRSKRNVISELVADLQKSRWDLVICAGLCEITEAPRPSLTSESFQRSVSRKRIKKPLQLRRATFSLSVLSIQIINNHHYIAKKFWKLHAFQSHLFTRKSWRQKCIYVKLRGDAKFRIGRNTDVKI